MGEEFDITSVIAGEIALGPAHASFDESTFSDRTTVAAHGTVTWDVTRLTRLQADVGNRFVPTDVAGTSIKLRTLASAGVRHELLKSLFLRGDLEYYREKFYELGRIDHNYEVHAGFEYYVNRFFSILGGYGYRVRDSNVPGRDFDKNVVMLTFNAHL